MDDGGHNYFFIFRARLLSPLSNLRPNAAEIDDACFFSKEELGALKMVETWQGVVAITYKGLDPLSIAWPNYPELSSVNTSGHWRIWM